MNTEIEKESQLAAEIAALAEDYPEKEIAQQFLERLAAGNLVRDDNEATHFIVYFCPYDSDTKQIFIGHHKKSGKWLFNGGHIDQGELLREALGREIMEEWGLSSEDFQIPEPRLLTITPINDSARKIPCKVHYDLWYFIPVDKKNFHPDEKRLASEFHEIRWMGIEEARMLVGDPNTLKAMQIIEDYLF